MRYPVHAGPSAEAFRRISADCSEAKPVEVKFFLGEDYRSKVGTTILVTEATPGPNGTYAFRGYRKSETSAPVQLQGEYNPDLHDGSIEFLSNPPKPPSGG